MGRARPIRFPTRGFDSRDGRPGSKGIAVRFPVNRLRQLGIGHCRREILDDHGVAERTRADSLALKLGVAFEAVLIAAVTAAASMMAPSTSSRGEAVPGQMPRPGIPARRLQFYGLDRARPMSSPATVFALRNTALLTSPAVFGRNPLSRRRPQSAKDRSVGGVRGQPVYQVSGSTISS